MSRERPELEASDLISALRPRGMTVFTLISGALLLGIVGALGTVAFSIDLWRRPDWGMVLLLYFLGLWPLWIASVMVYGLFRWRQGAYVVFPTKAPRTFVIVNFVIMVPVALAVELMLAAIPRNVSEWEWTWKTVLGVCLVGIPVIGILFCIRIAFKANLDELTRGNTDDSQDIGAHDLPDDKARP